MLYCQGMLCISGTTSTTSTTSGGNVLYVDGHLFDTNDLVQSFLVYRDCFVGVSENFVYFLPNDKDSRMKLLSSEERSLLPNDKDSRMKLLSSEERLLNNALSGSFTPYTCRNFGFTDIASIKKQRTHVGHFLGFLVYCGFKIECIKLIYNSLNKLQTIESSGSHDQDSAHKTLRMIKILHEMRRFGYKAYKVFVGKWIDTERIYTKVTEAIDPEDVTEDMLIEMSQKMPLKIC